MTAADLPDPDPATPSPDDHLAALMARREALIARGVPPQYAHIEALLELEQAGDDDEQ